MDARKYICGRVDVLQKAAELCEEVLVLVKFDAQGNVVGIDEAYKYEKSHSGKEHYGKGNEGLLFKKGKIVRKLPESELLGALKDELDKAVL